MGKGHKARHSKRLIIEEGIYTILQLLNGVKQKKDVYRVKAFLTQLHMLIAMLIYGHAQKGQRNLSQLPFLSQMS